MSNQDQAVAVLLGYYESIRAGDVRGISRYFDSSVTLISLTGSNVLSGSTHIDAAFETLVETWRALGVSLKIQYDRDEFKIEDIQSNVVMIRTHLTNFRDNGEVFESWNCMYVLVNTEDGWKISVATFDDKGTERFADTPSQTTS